MTTRATEPPPGATNSPSAGVSDTDVIPGPQIGSVGIRRGVPVTGELTERERAAVEQIIRWHVGCHVESPGGGYLGLCVENVLLRVESILAARAQVDADLIRAAEVRGARQALRDAAMQVPWLDPEMADEVIGWLRERADNLPNPEED